MQRDVRKEETTREEEETTQTLKPGMYARHRQHGFVYRILAPTQGDAWYCRYEGRGPGSLARKRDWKPMQVEAKMLRPMTESERLMWIETRNKALEEMGIL